MGYGMIATWRMAFEGVRHNWPGVKNGAFAGDVLEKTIIEVEDFANFISVGYGGLPNEEGTVQLDAAYMDGTTLEIGAVAGMEEVLHPISVARKLSTERFNSMRVGNGAKKFAELEGFKTGNLLTDKAKEKWQERLMKVEAGELIPYDGHDTIGSVVVDKSNHVVAGTSSSGLFMKKDGRVGDSPLSGSGFYADSDFGGAAATGLGEDLMKGILSYEVVRKLEEGYAPMDAAQQTLNTFEKKLKRKYKKAGAMSLVCMNNDGEWGVATNVTFTFVVATDKKEPTIYIAQRDENNKLTVEEASKEWMKEFMDNLSIRIE